MGRTDLYAGDPRIYGLGAYLYSPLFAQLLWPLSRLPYEVFRVAWAVPAVLTYAWLIRPMPWGLRVPFALLAAYSVAAGNIEWAIALCVISTRPEGWLIPALTKVTPAIGALWYVGAGSWSSVGRGLLASALLVGASFALAPGSWLQWIDVLRANAGASVTPGLLPLLPLRLVLAAIIALAAGKTGRLAPLAIVVLLAQPDVNPSTFALLATVPQLLERDHAR